MAWQYPTAVHTNRQLANAKARYADNDGVVPRYCHTSVDHE
jgi:hypothetical protein